MDEHPSGMLYVPPFTTTGVPLVKSNAALLPKRHCAVWFCEKLMNDTIDKDRKSIVFFMMNYFRGKATASQMCVFSDLSTTGNSKHLLSLQRKGLIKKVPPKSYALTEKSKHILLEVFGIPKEK